MAFAVPRIGVAVFIVRDDKVLVGTRIGSHGSGTIALPGGHLELGEGMAECGVREVKEETGIDLEAVQFVGIGENERSSLSLSLSLSCPTYH